jgi:hypothetical protein
MAAAPEAVVLVPIEQMSDAELAAMAAELEARGDLLRAAEMLEQLGQRQRQAGLRLLALAAAKARRN